MSNYTYVVNQDQTRVTVTTELDAFEARMNWPATADVSRRVSLLVGRPVRCVEVEGSSDSACEYALEPETNPVRIADTNYRIAHSAQLRLEEELNGRRDLDDEAPSANVWSRSPEWRAASEATDRAFAALEQAQSGAS